MPILVTDTLAVSSCTFGDHLLIGVACVVEPSLARATNLAVVPLVAVLAAEISLVADNRIVCGIEYNNSGIVYNNICHSRLVFVLINHFITQLSVLVINLIKARHLANAVLVPYSAAD